MTRYRQFAIAILAWAVGGLPGIAQNAPLSPPPAVPTEVFTRLRAQYIPEDVQDPDISENDKIRRYQSILREGGWAERQHPGATNLYLVRDYTLAAVRGLAKLAPSEEVDQQLVAIAQRQLADTFAPLKTRMMADLLFTRRQMVKLEEDSVQQQEVIQQFLGRYTDPAVVADALILGVEMSKMLNLPPGDTKAERQVKDWQRTLLDQLERDHKDRADARSTLNTMERRPFHHLPFKEQFKMQDGSTWSLPRDVLGRVTMLQFWAQEDKDVAGQAAEFSGKLDGPYGTTFQALYANGAEFLGIYLGTERSEMEKTIKDQKMFWPQSFSGLGRKDPLVEQIDLKVVPAYWLLDASGRVIYINYRDGFAGHTDPFIMVLRWIAPYVANTYDITMRTRYYRSGEFLLDELAVFPATAPAENGVPADKLEALRRRVFIPPSEALVPPSKLGWCHYLRRPTAVAETAKKVEVLREALAMGRTLEKEYPQAANLITVRNYMLVAARFVAHQARDREMAWQAMTIADSILAAKPPPAQALLAEFARLSGQLEQDERDAVVRITAFRQAYAKTDLNWAADICAILLLVECGEEPTRLVWSNGLPKQYPAPHPKLRGFMRDFCNINVDAQETTYNGHVLGLSAQRLALADKPLTAQLPLLNGGVLRLPSEKKKFVALHFWSVACPPLIRAVRDEREMPHDVMPGPDMEVVAVNLDEDKAKVVEYLKTRPDMKDWVHVFSGRGWHDPLARELDVYTVVRSVLLNRDGIIQIWGYTSEFGRHTTQLIKAKPK